ncbi:MAG: sigma-70 family RNA polymerase sigma factor [Candidatus Omnitrophica bacterium]|nr:sigma-70 family RNA polymerase sigma factor [Candidatus Omnitrophota bacterium]
MNSDDHELIAGVASRDPEAFRALMERHASGVINLAYRFLGTVADAEDVAQDVFFRLYQHPPRLSPSGKLFTWLYRVTVNRCLDLLRQRPAGGKLLSLDEPPAGGEESERPLAEKLAAPAGSSARDQAVQAEMVTLTRRAIAALPVPLRLPLILSTFEELSHEEIGQILGLSPKAVERRLARARELLKQRLAPHL